MSPTLTDDSSTRTDSLEGSNKFWCRPSEEQLLEDSSLEPKDVFFIDDDNYINEGDDDDEEESNNLWLGQQSQTTSTSQKRRQTKMLLVVLIESFCSVYGERPEANHKIFFLICQTLRSLGLIDSEFVDEMSNVRSTYQSAFQRLFYTAVQTVRNRELFQQHQRMIMQTPWDDDEDEYDDDDHCDYDANNTNDEDDMQAPSISESTTLSSEQLLFNLSVQNSRYRNDFVEINMLGKGGFASVWRARNKLDGIDYAVKKIRLGNTLDTGRHAPYEKIFREIKHLARLEHKNVVRYYSSWLELAVDNSVDNDDESEDEDEEHEDSVFNGHDPMFDDHEFSIQFDESSLNNNDNDYEQSQTHIRFAENSDMTDTATTTESGTLCKPKSNASRVSKNSSNSGFDGEWVLYIQMQLCPSTLHDYIKFRNQHGQVDPQRNIEIFTQILEGVACIHGQGVIHRDLKPTNIFLSMPASAMDYPHRKSSQASSMRTTTRSRANSLASLSSSSPSVHYGSSVGAGCLGHDHTFSFDSVLTPHGLRSCMWDEPWVPKIGDFGLAAAMEDSVTNDYTAMASPTTLSNMLPSSSPTTVAESPKSQSSGSSVQSTTTATYPLSSSYPSRQHRPSIQRKHTVGVGTRTYASPEQLAHTPNAYDEKVDIYSLGIIFFELYKPFSTAMERAAEIECLKTGVFPDGFVEKYPKESALILWMMDVNPDCRPTAAQLLDFELFNHHSDSTKNDSTFATLQSELQAKSLALDKKTQEMAALCAKMERLEMEKEREMSLMQEEKLVMQQRLLELEQKLQEKMDCSNETSSPLATTTPALKVSTVSQY
ncbi:kinase-like domain-containing protein [Phascolomyces articulosus]|uniref:Eukaryotic translation initiation factor 2-alpha kinase 1 n=1 Tax=Phascolomyces articulosus TaxID=60185 RepID=A0AAD5PEV9_9FUNG|nr:kinase-like domain-containing protein [Phascolomyces articulosus]